MVGSTSLGSACSATHDWYHSCLKVSRLVDPLCIWDPEPFGRVRVGRLYSIQWFRVSVNAVRRQPVFPRSRCRACRAKRALCPPR
jgi:hypothetical protein